MFQALNYVFAVQSGKVPLRVAEHPVFTGSVQDRCLEQNGWDFRIASVSILWLSLVGWVRYAPRYIFASFTCPYITLWICLQWFREVLYSVYNVNNKSISAPPASSQPWLVVLAATGYSRAASVLNGSRISFWVGVVHWYLHLPSITQMHVLSIKTHACFRALFCNGEWSTLYCRAC